METRITGTYDSLRRSVRAVLSQPIIDAMYMVRRQWRREMAKKPPTKGDANGPRDTAMANAVMAIPR